MYKKLLKKIRYKRFIDSYPDIKFGSLLVAIFCSIFIVIATFTQIPLYSLDLPGQAYTNSIKFFSTVNSFEEITKIYWYIPQIPVVLFLGALLGPRIGTISVLIYLAAGLLGFPIFASGGGITYYKHQGFGYILGYLLGVYCVGNILSSNITSLKIIRAAIIGALSVHIVGILYISVLMPLQHYSLFTVFGWIWALSGAQLPFDIIISFITICLARPLRSIFWVALD